jgi:hypothetical protein
VDNAYFRFDIELTPEQNPPGTMDRLREDLRAWFVARRLSYGMGALGGNRHCYGEVGPDPPATEGDRQAMAEWIRGQGMCATVRLTSVVPFGPSIDMLAPITDWVFPVDTLTETDMAEAAAYHAELRGRVLTLRPRQG